MNIKNSDQDELKQKLIEYWGGCSVNSSTVNDELFATSIKLLIECDDFEKTDIYNWLLLKENYHNLFIEYIITFDELGKIIISESLSDEDLKKLNISRNDYILQDKLTLNHAVFIQEHRAKFYNEIIL